MISNSDETNLTDYDSLHEIIQERELELKSINNKISTVEQNIKKNENEISVLTKVLDNKTIELNNINRHCEIAEEQYKIKQLEKTKLQDSLDIARNEIWSNRIEFVDKVMNCCNSYILQPNLRERVSRRAQQIEDEKGKDEEIKMTENMITTLQDELVKYNEKKKEIIALELLRDEIKSETECDKRYLTLNREIDKYQQELQLIISQIRFEQSNFKLELKTNTTYQNQNNYKVANRSYDGARKCESVNLVSQVEQVQTRQIFKMKTPSVLLKSKEEWKTF